MLIKESAVKSKIGFNLLVWSGGLPDSFLPITERLKNIGYDGIECFMQEKDVSAYKKLGNHLQGIGLEATCVLGMGKDENPASESKTTRDNAVAGLKKQLTARMPLTLKLFAALFIPPLPGLETDTLRMTMNINGARKCCAWLVSMQPRQTLSLPWKH